MSTAGHVFGSAGSLVTSDVHVTGRRVIATLVDAVILAFVYNLLVLWFGEFDHPRAWEWNGTMSAVLPNVAYVVGLLAYYVLMEGYLGQTIGKFVAGIQVVAEDSGRPPGLRAATIRTAARVIDGLLGYVIAFVIVLASEKRQRIGDMAAGTLVIRR